MLLHTKFWWLDIKEFAILPETNLCNFLDPSCAQDYSCKCNKAVNMITRRLCRSVKLSYTLKC